MIVNLQVKHKTFGMGLVTALNGKYMTVKFPTAEKTFVYPDAFETFLTLSDGLVSEEIANDIIRAKEAKQEIIDKKTEENLRAMTRGIVIPGKEEAVAAAAGEDEENRFKRNENEEN